MPPIRFVLALALIPVATALAQVVSYDAAAGLFPEEQGWQHTHFCTPERWLADGLLYEDVDIGECAPPPGDGDRDTYKRPIDEFIGVPEFFVEWRMWTTALEPWGGFPGAVIAIGNQGGVNYWFGFAQDELEHTHDSFQIDEFIDITPGLHTYHLRIFNDISYRIYIDGEVVFEGAPAGPYPAFNPSIGWNTQAWTLDNVTQWQFVRYGVPPAPASGDFSGDGEVDDDDLFYFEECLNSPAGNWIGCAWADFDGDSDVDCQDADAFEAGWTDLEGPPPTTLCSLSCDPDMNGSGGVDAADLAILLGAWGPHPGHPADLNGDGAVGPVDLAQLLGAWGTCH